MTMMKTLLLHASGASAAEYALILAIVGTAIAAASILLGNTIANAMNTASTCISTQGGTWPWAADDQGTPPNVDTRYERDASGEPPASPTPNCG